MEYFLGQGNATDQAQGGREIVLPGDLDSHLLVYKRDATANALRARCQSWSCDVNQARQHSSRPVERLLQYLLLDLLGAPQLEVRFHARLHFLGLKGLGNVIDRSGS